MAFGLELSRCLGPGECLYSFIHSACALPLLLLVRWLTGRGSPALTSRDQLTQTFKSRSAAA